MIRINLLGVAAPTPTPVPGAPPPAASVLIAMAAVGALLVAGGAAGITYWLWTKQKDEQQARYNKELRRQQELKDIAAKNVQYQAQIAELTRRDDTIKQLENSSVGPSDMMNHLADAVNRTRDIWLSDVTPSGGRIQMNGQAFSVDSIARFMSALAGTGSFPDVHLQEYVQTSPTMFRFRLDCAYKLPTPAAPPATPAAAAPTGVGAPARRAGM